MQSLLAQPYIFGDWGGERTKLQTKGITFGFQSVNDLLLAKRGDTANWSRVRGTLDIDFSQAELVPGLKFHVTGLWQAGSDLGAHVGSIANPSSLVSANTARLDSWWFEQALARNKLFLRVGQFAGLDFYGNQLDGSSYILEPLGYAFGNLFTANFESFNPAGTPAAEIRVVPNDHFYWKAAMFSGNRDPYRDDTNGLHFKFKDTPVIATEVGYLVDPSPSETETSYPGVYKFGATTNPGSFTNIVTGIQSRGNYLLYFTANQTIYRPYGSSGRGLDVNFGFDWTPKNLTRNYSQITGGLRYHGILPHRSHDTVSAGIVYSRTSLQTTQAHNAFAPTPFGSEKAIEINYSLQVTRWHTFQPVFQYYLDPGANPQRRNSTVVGFRTSFSL